MGIATFPASSAGLSSVVKSIQRGSAATAGNITITSVTTSKTQVLSFSTSSAGSVAATGAINAASGTASAFSGTTSATSSSGSGVIVAANAPIYGGTPAMQAGGTYTYNNRYGATPGPYGAVSFNVSESINAANVSMNAQNVSLNATNITGGSTSLTSAVYGAYLVDATTIYATGPCRYEVVEYN
jgi:hypothetical protein